MIDTGVEWCRLRVTEELEALVEKVQAGERTVKELAESVHDRLVREIVCGEVGAAHALASDGELGTSELFDRCFDLKGKPLDEAPARRDMRERIRVYRRIMRYGGALPHSLDNVLELWDEAMCGEPRLYKESEIAQFRMTHIPFGHRENPFENTSPPAGRETVEPSRIPDETKALLAFIGRDDLPSEIVAAVTHFLCGHIHPFSDGNGHLARMLSCIRLANDYTVTTILSLLRRLQEDRGTMNLAMAQTVRQKGDLAAVVRVFLEMLLSAERDVLPAREGFAHLPLRFLPTADYELISANRPGREVYRTNDEHIVKTVAVKGRLSRACAVYEAVRAAGDAGARVARPIELVRTTDGYAMVLDLAPGIPLRELVASGKVSPTEAGLALARCLSDLHVLHGDKERMRDVRGPFLGMVDNISPWISEPTARACRSTILGIPATTTLIHGDVHMGNVIVGDDRSTVLVDADTVSMGHAVFDLACVFSTLTCEYVIDPVRAERFHGIPADSAKLVWQSLIRTYRADSDCALHDDAERQIELLAWVVLLNRLVTTGRGDMAFGESALKLLQAAGLLAQITKR